jgi:UDP-N-acetylmuramoyl-L-alanyl-D-glutamate--2,6-diaminopimelate ligase
MAFSLQQIADIINGDLKNYQTFDSSFSEIFSDTRKITKNSVFCAIKGVNSDGHQYVAKAIELGAGLIISESDVSECKVPYILVKDTREAWSKLSMAWFGNPQKNLIVCGVTGTNGKTTIHWLLGQALDLLGKRCLRLGTLGCYLGDEFIEESLTTADAWDIARLTQLGLQNSADSLAIEVSSHGLDQKRVSGIDFNVAIFTNLTRDHLDYHKTMENYFSAKLKLFESLRFSNKDPKGAVVNADDQYGQEILKYLKDNGINAIAYGQKRSYPTELTLLAIDMNHIVSNLKVQNEQGQIFDVSSSLVGLHNAYNLMAVWGALKIIGYSDLEIVEILPELKAATGRLESVGHKGLGVYVDYAHTPDALVNVLMALKPICLGKLWVVFGCGGDRDKGKRPIMGEVATRLADKVVVTSDNPRTEDPEAIIADILSSGIKPTFVTPDRREAIQYAIQQARFNDVILIAGKGHEDYQIIGTTKHPFSDQLTAKEFIAKSFIK